MDTASGEKGEKMRLIDLDSTEDYILDGRYVIESPKRGHWIKNGDRYCECSVCHHEGNISGQDNYCWFCGAKMEIEEMMEW